MMNFMMKKTISGFLAALTLLSVGCTAEKPSENPAESSTTDVTSPTPPTLSEKSGLIMTKDGECITGFSGEVSAAELAAEMAGDVTVKAPDGSVLEGDAKVPTGSTVHSAGESVKILVAGDANGDGLINADDAAAITNYLSDKSAEIAIDAADVDLSGAVDATDAELIEGFLSGDDVKLGIVKIAVDENAQTAENEDVSTKLWADHGTRKYSRDTVPDTERYTYTINAAKNEAEGATVYISPAEDKRDITVSVTDFVNAYGDRVKADAYNFYYIKMGDYGYMPDPLMPTESSYTASVGAGKSCGFYVKATTDKDTYPGLYEATVSILQDGAEIKRAKIYLNVWNILLDDEDAPRSSFGLDGSAASFHGINGSNAEEYKALYKKYYDYLLDNRICAFMLPYNPETDAADVYLNDPRVNSFVVYGEGYGGVMNTTLNQLQARYSKLSQNEDWFAKGYFYCVDEPYDAKNDSQIASGQTSVYNHMKTVKELIDKHYPGGKQVVPVETGTHITLYDGFMQLYRETTDILCPKTYAFVPNKYYGTELGNGNVWEFHQAEIGRDFASYADFADKCIAEDENKESWWYFAGLPAEPLTTYHASADGMYVRMSGFQMYQEDVTGVLYYATNDYRGSSPYNGVNYMTGVGVAAYGNGVLLYPGGRRFGYDGPIGSVRCDYIRDSFEDYMLLSLAERVLGKEETDKFVQTVTRDLTDFETDAEAMQKVRADIAGAIIAAGNIG